MADERKAVVPRVGQVWVSSIRIEYSVVVVYDDGYALLAATTRRHEFNTRVVSATELASELAGWRLVSDAPAAPQDIHLDREETAQLAGILTREPRPIEALRAPASPEVTREAPFSVERARELAACGRAWEPEVRLLGNVRADEMAAIADYAAASSARSSAAERLAAVVQKFRSELPGLDHGSTVPWVRWFTAVEREMDAALAAWREVSRG